MSDNIHLGQPVLKIGAKDQNTNLVIILLHGRGSNAQAMVPLAEALQMEEVRFMIPQAGLNRWYPYSAFGPVDDNEPDLSFALEAVGILVKDLLDEGFTYQQIALGGFSQGACLAAEYLARNAGPYAGLFLLSGALIGPEGTVRDYPGSFEGMPVFIGGSDIDPWVSHDFLKETALVFEKMGASVDFRTYDAMGHTINQDEVETVRSMIANAIQVTEDQTP
jgi:predicted esterase